MRIHNLVQDLVVQKVEELFAEDETVKTLGLAHDPASKYDVICYVLNRTAPRYVVSGRGFAHSETSDYQDKVQHLADIALLVREGMDSVAKNRRERSVGSFGPEDEGPYFNFPSIIGRIFNGGNFEPASDLTVSLYHKGELVKVIDPNWQNPYRLVVNTAGTYLFWPHPQKAPKGELNTAVEFELRVDDPRYEPLHYFFSVASQAESDFSDFVDTTASLRLKDLYLFPRE